MKNLAAKILILFVLFIPLWSFLTWFFWPGEKLNTLILDKTNNPEKYADHRSFNWILTHEKYTNNLQKEYQYSRDYLGYHPEVDENLRINDLEQYNQEMIDSIADQLDMAYYVDAEGVVKEDWPEIMDPRDKSAILYGGLTEKDHKLLETLYRNYKLILAEYNTLGRPTDQNIRHKMENLFALEYSGWTGRYFASLDPETGQIPEWIKEQYRKRHNEEYNFGTEAGIILLHEEGNILVLSMQSELELDAPIINTPIKYQEKYELPPFVEYNYWFEINKARNEDDVISSFKIHTNEKGDSLLAAYNIPQKFPAVIGDYQENLRFYFCGDFAENPVKDKLAYFKGIEHISSLFYNKTDKEDREEFFWEYYEPLLDNLIGKYKNRLKVTGKERTLPAVAEEEPSIYETEQILQDENYFTDEKENTPTEAVNADKADKTIQKQSPSPKSESTVSSVKNPFIQKGIGGKMTTERWKAMSRSGRNKSGQIKSESKSPATIPQVQQTASENEIWHLIIGSFREEERAKKYVETLGYPNLKIHYIAHLNTNRVAYGSYSDLRSAQLASEDIIKRHPEAWVVKF